VFTLTGIGCSLWPELCNEEDINQLLGYLENHKHQMNYQYYRQQGWMIGSGAIESAHRTLLQVRMKRSGQRWANDGCDNVIKWEHFQFVPLKFK